MPVWAPTRRRPRSGQEVSRKAPEVIRLRNRWAGAAVVAEASLCFFFPRRVAKLHTQRPFITLTMAFIGVRLNLISLSMVQGCRPPMARFPASALVLRTVKA